MFAGLLIPVAASARVGETQEDFEHRILQPFVGKIIPREKPSDIPKEARDEEQLLRQQPFYETKPHFPDGTRERKYWKSAVPNMLSNENGWRVHVFFHEGRSVMEAYLRVGDSLNEFEIRNILRANQGTSEWRAVEVDSLESRASAIGCDYQLADGTMRARVVGNWLLVFSAKLDTHVKEQLRILAANRANQQEEKARTQQATASGSTSGF